MLVLKKLPYCTLNSLESGVGSAMPLGSCGVVYGGGVDGGCLRVGCCGCEGRVGGEISPGKPGSPGKLGGLSCTGGITGICER
ncbi:MAG: hypothetical protein VB018_15825 [Lachnospiraceae bacterium]|nr:hypothetical protein [Lachnospiraceae bacterium]